MYVYMYVYVLYVYMYLCVCTMCTRVYVCVCLHQYSVLSEQKKRINKFLIIILPKTALFSITAGHHSRFSKLDYGVEN
jgi:hypothetical protein